MSATPHDCDDTPEIAGPLSQQEEFLIVGIGASAGGIEALRSLFSHVQKDSGAAYVVILHLAPDHESRLAEVIQGHAAIPIEQVRDRVKVEPNRAYVVPPNQSLSMVDGHLVLSSVNTAAERRAPVDIFFRTLGEAQHGRAVAVVLSGTGSDGSSGIARVKECGGICLVQDPTEALHAEMPQHAIDTHLVDDVLLASEIPAKIAAYQAHRARIQDGRESDRVADEQALRDILGQLRLRTGHEFANYKRSTVMRRIQRRVAVHELPDLASYAAWLRDHPDEARVLLKDLLISVTNFFRDAEAFKALEREVIPELFRNKTADDNVRVWVAGCATGEEVYTVAMLLCEHAGDPLNAPSIQLFATDIDDWALAKARTGFYTSADVASVSPERVRRFFVPEREGYRVRSELRDIVLFATHNLLKHPPYGHIDLVTCRNLLIYINRQAQRHVMDVFHFALNANGYLFLGTSETVDGANELFRPVNREARIFQSCPVERRTALSFANLNLAPRAAFRELLVEEPHATPAPRERHSNSAVHLRLLEHYAPPSVVVNETHQVVHLSNNAGRYMRIPGGELSASVFDLVRTELRPDLRTALLEAAQHGMRVATRRVPVAVADAVEHVRIIVSPASGANEPDRGFTLVLFEAGPQSASERRSTDATAEAAAAGPARRLQEELGQLQAQLRAAVEQHAVQQEELKASNEELQSINEELRSTSEELETGKEELQSYNEELSTVNQELKVKIDELTQANNDTRNLMNSTDTATVFLDRSDRVKRFTPRARDLFKLLPSDIGRPLLDLSHRLRYDELLADVNRVLETLQSVEREIESDDGRWYIAKVLPYRTETDRIDGTVLTFVDITERKHAEDAVRASEEQFRRAIEDAPIPVIMHAEDGEVLQLSGSWTQLTGYSLKDLPTIDAWLSRAYGYGADAVREHMHGLFRGTKQVLDIEFAIRTRTGEQRYWSFSASSPGTLRDGRRFIIGMAIDITERKRASEALVRSDARLRLTLDAVTDYAIFTMDTSGLVDSWNRGAERIFGYTEAEALGRSAAFIFTPEDRASGGVQEEMRVARETGSATDERWHLRKDGTRFFASGVLSSIRHGTQVLGYIKVAQDLTSKREADEALRQARDLLEDRVMERTRELADANMALRMEVAERMQSEDLRVRLLGHVVDAQENERRRLARELHDQFGQQITALTLKLSTLKSMKDLQPEVRSELEALETIARQLDSDVEHLAWELRPTVLDDLGLVDALNDYTKTWSKHFGLEAHLHTSGIDGARLSDEIETVLYRIAQEALNNVAKHAGASSVELILAQRADHVSLIIEDDGVGFDADNEIAIPSGLGVAGMRERAAFAGGTLEIESRRGAGTSIFVRIPTPA